jgi:hypothetical protein
MGAVTTGRRAALAVSHVVPGAFVSAGVADLGAKPTQFGGELRASSHEPGGHTADDGALPIQADAAGKHLHVLFLKAGGGAVFAFRGALIAGFNTRSVLVVHEDASASSVPLTAAAIQ